jgi:hypothetical protein
MLRKKKSFQVNPSLFSTDLELRDKHMRESIFSDAQKKIIPILFYVENTNCNNDLENCIIQGKISLNNQEKNIQLNLKGKKKISTGFPIKLSEFKITPPSFMGVTVQDEVVISVNAASK